MTTTINGRTPEEIKELLANHRNYTFSLQELLSDALDYIQQLERERDAAVAIVPRLCASCIRREKRFLSDGQMDAVCITCLHNGRRNWQWRGVQEVE